MLEKAMYYGTFFVIGVASGEDRKTRSRRPEARL
jgi:hypothetical protein